MLVPLEIAVGMVIVAISLVWSAMRWEPSALRRALTVSMAIGIIMIAIAGRFPPVPGQTGFSPFVMAGVVVFIASLALSAGATLVGVIRRNRPSRRPSGRAG
jgi:hypothetical protein